VWSDRLLWTLYYRKKLRDTTCLAPNATKVSKSWTGLTSGINGIIPHDLKPLVPVPTVSDLDQAAANYSWIVFHPLPSKKSLTSSGLKRFPVRNLWPVSEMKWTGSHIGTVSYSCWNQEHGLIFNDQHDNQGWGENFRSPVLLKKF
jgi:hypothetical protein